MTAYKMISSDSHIIEPPDLWTNRIEPKFRDRLPRVMLSDRQGEKLYAIACTIGVIPSHPNIPQRGGEWA